MQIECGSCGRVASTIEWAWAKEISQGICPECGIVVREKEGHPGKFEHQYLVWREWKGSRPFKFIDKNTHA